MITTITTNTALDKTYLVSGFKRQGVHRVELASTLPGGKGVNVARVLAQLGIPTLCSGVVAGFTGQHICALLDGLAVEHDFLWTTGESRQCLTLVDQANNLHSEFLEPGPPYTAALSQALIAKVRQLAQRSHYVVIAGNPPQGTDPHLLEHLVRAARATGARVALDAHASWLQLGISAQPHIIIPNWEEFEELTGPCPDTSTAVTRAQTLIASGIELVLISKGAAGAVAVARDGAWQVTPPQVPAVSAVGCGDAMLGGLLTAFTRGDNLITALRFATAVAAANTLTLGAGVFNSEDVTRLYESVTVERLA